MTEDELAILRRAYARQIVAVAGVSENDRLESAFRAVSREQFLGLDPWSIVTIGRPPIRLPTNDPVYVYQDVLVALASERGINNGGPSLHARMLDALSPQPGHRVVHLGAGTGYYTAILAHLVGPGGHVTAVEAEPSLGIRARTALRETPSTDVIVDDAQDWPREPVDRVYVNFGVTKPAAAWIEGLTAGGRLVFPLGVPRPPSKPGGVQFAGHGAAFVVERSDRGFAASAICPAYFIHAEGQLGTVDAETVERLKRAFQSGTMDFVRSLHWRQPSQPERCWYWSPEWSLSFDPP